MDVNIYREMMCVTAACGCLFGIGNPCEAGVRYETVALTGDVLPHPVPGVSLAPAFQEGPQIDASGGVVFRGLVEGSGVTSGNDEGIWYGTPAGVSLVAVEGGVVDPAQDPSETYQSFFRESVTSDGRVVFLSGTSEGVRLQAGTPGSLISIYDSSVGVPGLSSFAVSIDDVSWNSDAQGLFFARSSSPDAVVLAEPGGGRVVGVSNQQLPLIDPMSRIISVFDTPRPALGGDGSVAFLATIDTGTNGTRGGVLLAGPPDGLRYVTAAQDDVSAYTQSGTSMGQVGWAVLDGSGRLVFLSNMVRPGGSLEFGLWSWADGQLDLLAETGGETPIDGLRWRYISVPSFPFDQGTVDISDSGHIAFLASLSGDGVTGENDGSIWGGRPDALRMVARTGDPAPGTDVWFQQVFDTPRVDEKGRVAFTASLVGEGVEFSNSTGVWMEDALGRVQKVIRAGDTIDIDPDPLVEDLRVVRVPQFFNSDSVPYGSPINASGQVALGVFFDNPSSFGIIRATLTVCVGDWNDDGVVSVGDILDYLQAWITGNTFSDLNENESLDTGDIMDFLAAWSAGCG